MAEEPYTIDQLRVFMSPQFLAVLAEAARLYTATEDDTGLSLPADLWHFVAWCQALVGELPERNAQGT
jgi:hypothetical protein